MVYKGMSKESMSFINDIMSSGASRGCLYVVAVGRVISNRLCLPVSAIVDFDNYYNMTLRMSALNYINTLNSISSLNIEMAEIATKSFFSQRYNAVNPLSLITVYSDDTAINDIFGIRRAIPEKFITAIKEDSKKFMVYNNSLELIFREIDITLEVEATRHYTELENTNK